ncbi:hypothetical protein MLD38_033506 [Melastoma candidum]|uniref:Uncharacterized protein n=1 Tax=Melastoma candidum TaxID=119954 RepID=A0ACB9M8T6_9MYRT|nr:hypothetical protein MLD38_033506 [Melastoma candidum]
MARDIEADQHEDYGDNHNRIIVVDAFKDRDVPPWKDQITVRAMLIGLILSIVFNFIVCKLNLTTGVIPSFNVAAGLLDFAIVRFWTALLDKCSLLKAPLYPPGEHSYSDMRGRLPGDRLQQWDSELFDGDEREDGCSNGIREHAC